MELRSIHPFLLHKIGMSEWGYTKREVKVCDNTLRLTVGATAVVSARVVNNTLQLQWENDFGTWDPLQKSAELQTLVDTANDRLRRSAIPGATGKGSGKGGSTTH